LLHYEADIRRPAGHAITLLRVLATMFSAAGVLASKRSGRSARKQSRRRVVYKPRLSGHTWPLDPRIDLPDGYVDGPYV